MLRRHQRLLTIYIVRRLWKYIITILQVVELLTYGRAARRLQFAALLGQCLRVFVRKLEAALGGLLIQFLETHPPERRSRVTPAR